ncbi:hypothetical protein CC2G_004970, partial [Coprinopsis cinerea AmutBmut pab1-1]
MDVCAVPVVFVALPALPGSPHSPGMCVRYYIIVSLARCGVNPPDRLHYGLSPSCKALWAISFFAFYASGSLANSLLGARVVALSGQKFYVVLFAKIYYVETSTVCLASG